MPFHYGGKLAPGGGGGGVTAGEMMEQMHFDVKDEDGCLYWTVPETFDTTKNKLEISPEGEMTATIEGDSEGGGGEVEPKPEPEPEPEPEPQPEPEPSPQPDPNPDPVPEEGQGGKDFG